MHANRNKKAVKRVEKGMMKANRIRNLFAVFAIVLTTFMITTVFSLGINYMENMKLMQVRTAGTTANASLAMPTEKQEQQIKNLEYVKTVGTQYMVGSVAEKNDDGFMPLDNRFIFNAKRHEPIPLSAHKIINPSA